MPLPVKQRRPPRRSARADRSFDVLAHSQGGLSVYPTLAARPVHFLAHVAVEALGSCTAITPDYPTSVLPGWIPGSSAPNVKDEP